MMNLLMIKKTGQPHGTSVNCLIAEFSKQDEVNYLYFTHDVQAGLVTYKKEKTMIQ